MTQSHVSDAMRNAVGTEIGRSVSYPVGENDIRRWAIATYWPSEPPRRFIDAPADGSPLIAPEEINVFAWASASSEASPNAIVKEVEGGINLDFTENQIGIEGPGLTKALNGGMRVEYTGVPIKAGDVITSVRTLGEYTEREGRLGLMLFSSTVDTWSNQDGDVVKRSSMTLIRY